MSETLNIGNAADVATRTDKALTVQKQDRLTVAHLMGSPHGRAWMWRKLTVAHIFTTDFTGEALSSAFRQGERNIGLQLHAEVMGACPDHYLLMIKENGHE